MVKRDHIEKYLDGELTNVERHEFERRMLEDPFLSDAVEGLQLLSDPDERKAILDDLERQFTETLARIRREAARRRNWTIAASVSAVLIAAAAYLGLRGIDSEDPTIAQQTAPSTEVLSQNEGTNQPISGAESDEEKADDADRDEPITALEEEPPLSDPETEEVIVDLDAEITEESPMALANTTTDSLGVDEALLAERERESAESLLAAEEEMADDSEAGEEDLGQGIAVEVDDSSLLEDDTTARDDAMFSQAPQEVAGAPAQQQEDMLTEEQESDVAKRRESTAAAKSVVAESPVFVPAAPAGGGDAYDLYVTQNLVYPQAAVDNQIVGNVIVEFNIDPSGNVGNFTIVQSLGSGCDEEAIRLIREGPNWVPATRDGVPVDSRVQYTVEFAR